MKSVVETKFYEFRQNNSGGSFINSNEYGICEHVIIEGINASQANARAEEIGIYFDGCENDIDCPCCGDRWYKVDESDGYNVPSIYGEPIENKTKSFYREKCFIHYLNGEIEKVTFKDPE